MKVIHHNDMDGRCAAAIVYKRFDWLSKNDFFEQNYNMDFPFYKIKSEETVIILDYSLQKPGDFKKLLQLTQNVIWIDHHKTAIEQLKEFDSKIQGSRKNGVSGCELTWEYFFPEERFPRVVELIGDYDIWAFEFGDDSKKLQFGVRAFNTHPMSEKWNDWLNPDYDPKEEINIGGWIKGYQDGVYADMMKTWGFFAEFHGYKTICCNGGAVSSQLFDSVKEKYDIMASFIYDGSQFTVNLYSKNDIDVSEIAKKYGGGGHKNAAGFSCKELPFKKEKAN